MPHVLRAISGSQAGAVYVLGERTLIGRASDCDIQILHEGVSRHHARITREDDGSILVLDLSSDNGTFVEGERVDRHVLTEGEVLRFMRARFVFEMDEADAVTSEVFRRKVTSGDSLRQTVLHKRELAAIRARITQGFDGMISEHARAHSRPQAAAPAPSGARPGAASTPAVGRSTGAETRSRTKEYPTLAAEDATDPASVRRPTPTTPPRGDEPSALGHERWPQHPGREPAVIHDDPSRSNGRGAEVMGPARRRRTASRLPAAASAHALVDDVGTYAEGRGQRDRITAMPASWLRAPGMASTEARAERSHGAASDGPSGRMAPAAPAAMGAEEASSAASGAGWARVPRPQVSECGMRPGATLSGIPRVDDLPSRATMQPAAVTPSPASSSSRRTAEYGAIVEGAPAPAPRRPAYREQDLEAMTTIPSRRRVSKLAGSRTPTEEVPRIDDTSRTPLPTSTSIPARSATPIPASTPASTPAPTRDEPDAPTRPRIARSARWTRHPPTSIAYEDTMRIPWDEARARADALAAARSNRGPRPRHGLERLAEIVEYRELRSHALQGGALDSSATERYSELERQLQQQPAGDDDLAAMRRYHRFDCSVPALLRPSAAAEPTVVEIEDVSAGGAKITYGQHTLVAGDLVLLSVELAGANSGARPRPPSRGIVLEARVVWSQPQEATLGVVFVGAPRHDAALSSPSSSPSLG